MTTKVGKLSVLSTETLLIQDGNDVWFEFDFDDWLVKLNIIFKDNPDSNDSTTTIESKDGYGIVTLTNFADERGTSFPPVIIGQHESANLSLYMSGFGDSIGDVKRVIIQFYTGEDENGGR